jgi:GNAT superfamily N-acetyltransferase
VIRVAETHDLNPLLELYMHLHGNPIPEEAPEALWREIMNDPNHYVIVAEENGRLVSSCVLMVVLNLTRDQRPYALVENVVTHEAYRKRGLASAVLNFAKEIAAQRGCYKMESTLRFYERCGFNSNDKTAFIKWLD